jgi:glutamate/aspartate transport system permease protein
MELGVFLQPSASGDDTYLGWMFAGFKMTIALSLTAWLVALLLGALIGVLRTVPNRMLAGIATAWVELFRNVPLLVQLFIWYFVLPELLPASPAMPTSNPIRCCSNSLPRWCAWIVHQCPRCRAGACRDQLPKGQNAGLALGLTLPQTYRFVMLPMAFRLVVPPLTSEFLNIFKNSAVCSTIGLLELAAQGRQLVDYTAQPYESFIAVTLSYIIINVTVMTLMHKFEKRIAVPGYIGGK